MQLQQVATTWTRWTNTLLIVKSFGMDISRIVVTKIWLEWTTFLLVLFLSFPTFHYNEITFKASKEDILKTSTKSQCKLTC